MRNLNFLLKSYIHDQSSNFLLTINYEAKKKRNPDQNASINYKKFCEPYLKLKFLLTLMNGAWFSFLIHSIDY
jgi:hypothetical protein